MIVSNEVCRMRIKSVRNGSQNYFKHDFGCLKVALREVLLTTLLPLPTVSYPASNSVEHIPPIDTHLTFNFSEADVQTCRVGFHSSV